MVDKSVLATETNKIVNKQWSTFGSEEEQQLIESLNSLMASIPEKRKKSYGIVSVIVVFCKSISKQLDVDAYDLGYEIYSKASDYRAVCIGLGLLSHVGVEEPLKVLPILKQASDHELWELKEFVQMFIRKITKVHKDMVQEFLIELTASDNPNYRRFASEALRPVVENKWIQEEPEYSLRVLRLLFTESDKFPKVSVGNNLSDLSRKNPELILEVVKELKQMKNEHSDFIAHRACRNLVKIYPQEVMDLLEMDVYEYKGKKYRRHNR